MLVVNRSAGRLLSPAMSFTNICIVGSGSADDARLLMEVMLLERIVTASDVMTVDDCWCSGRWQM